MTQTTVREDVITEHRPVALLDASHPIEFQIYCNPDEYVHLRETIFYLTMHVKGRDSHDCSRLGYRENRS